MSRVPDVNRELTETEFLAEMLKLERLAAQPTRPPPETWSELLAMARVLVTVKARRKWRELRRVLRTWRA